jgi:hypothetical protein
MTYSVYVTLKNTPTGEQEKMINQEFEKIHDQTFKQEVNININTWKGELLEMRHGVNFDLYPNHIEIDIPCHWSYNHLIQTAKDIVSVIKTLNISYSKITLSY